MTRDELNNYMKLEPYYEGGCDHCDITIQGDETYYINGELYVLCLDCYHMFNKELDPNP